MLAKQKKSFGIISGAGPMAGICLMTQIMQYCQQQGAWRDRDFPEVRLHNIPFSEMLESGYDASLVRAELDNALMELENTSNNLVIACNTLHLFLPTRNIPGFINLIDLVKARIPDDCVPIVIASKTSAENNLHGKLLNIDCEYWHPEKSQHLIDAILAGKTVDLDFLFALAKQRTVILGCTEYSLAVQHISLPDAVIDPLKLAAELFGKMATSKMRQP